MRKYETMLIASPELDEDQMKSLLDEVSDMIRGRGGSVEEVDVWGLRKLEYPVERQETGRYAVVNFEASEDTAAGLERSLRLRDEILRTKTLVRRKG